MTVDDDDYLYLVKFKWIISDGGYAIHCMRAENRTVKLRIHRFIMGVTDSKILVDHISGDKLDNRKENLRIASNSLNRHNCKTDISKVKLGVFRGVHYRADRGTYEVKVSHNSKNVDCGRFENILDAAKAYDKAVTKLYGDDAVTNAKIIEQLYKEFFPS